jgi:hypothetical protein
MVDLTVVSAFIVVIFVVIVESRGGGGRRSRRRIGERPVKGAQRPPRLPCHGAEESLEERRSGKTLLKDIFD